MIEFALLGPLEVTRDGEPVPIGRGKQRALLAILLLNGDEVVSSERLIDELWGEAPPETAAKALQVHVSQLRKALEPERGAGAPARVLITKAPGYTLAADPDRLDLAQFERLRTRAARRSVPASRSGRPTCSRRRWTSGAGRRLPISRTSRSRSPPPRDSPTCGWLRSRTGSRRISPAAAPASWSASSSSWSPRSRFGSVRARS